MDRFWGRSRLHFHPPEIRPRDPALSRFAVGSGRLDAECRRSMLTTTFVKGTDPEDRQTDVAYGENQDRAWALSHKRKLFFPCGMTVRGSKRPLGSCRSTILAIAASKS